jgi:PAS domain S-box-containing protein
MKTPLRILLLEDDANDAELVEETLETSDISCLITRVDTEADFIASLEKGETDLILADHTLPSFFDGISALKIALQRWPLVPFIFVSGTLDEEVAVEALKSGATDYVFKTRLSRIVPSVTRALRESRERAELRRASEALQRSETYLAEAQRLSHTGSFGWNLSSGEIYWSRESFRIFGYEGDDKATIEMVFRRTHPDDEAVVRGIINRAAREQRDFDYEHRLLMPDHSVKHVHVVGHLVRNESSGVEFVGAVTDITERKRAERDLRNALDQIKSLRDELYDENIALRKELGKAPMFEEIVGTSAALHAVLARISKVAPTDSTVLVTGETGTGKELIARAIHERSQRSAKPFVSVNCAAIPSSLIASELFGHEKGAFTGAVQRRLGRFELAEGGTIFLDEIGELPHETQVALLRVLQEREFERVGGSKSIRANVRVIAATNRNLERSIEGGAFRSDLYYRLNVFPLDIPPLRQRREDIPLLVEYFIGRFAAKAGKKFSGISKATLERLKTYAWPGNIRELQNIIERSVIVCETESFTVDGSWLSTPSETPNRTVRPFSKLPASLEKEMIEAALAESGGRVSGPAGAAVKLGLPASTVDSKIKALKINKHRFRALDRSAVPDETSRTS